MARNPWVLPDGFDADTRKAIAALALALKKSGAKIPQDAFTQLRLGNIDAFLSYVDWDKIRDGFGDLENVLTAAAQKGGTSTFTLGGVDAELLFNLIDERAVIYAQERVGKLIVEITDQMRETVRETIALAQGGEMTYQQAALRLQSTIPLTTRDAGAVNKFIDKQFNRFIRDGLSQAKATVKAQNMGANYAAKLLTSRTKTIARTEIIDASMSGRYIGWEAGVTAGYISNDSVKEWIAEPDACPICSALDGKLIGWNQEWQFPEGVSAGSTNRMPPAHPNCRCSVVILPPDFSDNVFTPASGGEMPEEASEFLKHMQGQHDQSSHGGKGSSKFTTKNYENLTGKSSDEFQAAIADLGISDAAAEKAENRFMFRSVPAPAEFETNFKALDSAVNRFVQNNPVSIMTESSLVERIIDDGEVKSIFSFGDSAKGKDYKEHRMAYEKVAFGYEGDLPVELRPISGVVFPAQHNDEILDVFGENYGSVQLIMKDSVKSRTTFTVGDSLDTFQRPTSIGGKVPRTFDLGQTAQRAKTVGNTYFDDKTFHAASYIEAQIHGGVKSSDIDKVVIFDTFLMKVESLTSKLDNLGISWEMKD